MNEHDYKTYRTRGVWLGTWEKLYEIMRLTKDKRLCVVLDRIVSAELERLQKRGEA